MSDAQPQPAPSDNGQIKTENEQIVEIDLSSLTDTQKISLITVLFAFLVQVVYLINLNIVSGIIKSMITQQYQALADYVTAFINSFVPYLLVVFIIFALYSVYVLLLDDPNFMKLFYQIFKYLLIALVVDFILFFMSSSTGNPYTTELFTFFLMLLINLIIAFIPFGVYEFLKIRETKK